MKSHNAELLKALVEGRRDLRTLNGVERSEVLSDLRAEAFWSERAGALNEEVLALRPLEKFVRLSLAGAKLKEDQADDLRHALSKLDAVRGNAGGSSRDAQVIKAADVGDAAAVLGLGKKGRSARSGS